MLIIQGEELKPDSSKHTKVSARKGLSAQPIRLWSLNMSPLEKPTEMSELKGWRAITCYLFRFVCFSWSCGKGAGLTDLTLITSDLRSNSTVHAHLRMWLVQRQIATQPPLMLLHVLSPLWESKRPLWPKATMLSTPLCYSSCFSQQQLSRLSDYNQKALDMLFCRAANHSFTWNCICTHVSFSLNGVFTAFNQVFYF